MGGDSEMQSRKERMRRVRSSPGKQGSIWNVGELEEEEEGKRVRPEGTKAGGR